RVSGAGFVLGLMFAFAIIRLVGRRRRCGLGLRHIVPAALLGILGVILGIPGRKLVLVAAAGLLVFASLMMLMLMMAMLFVAGGRPGVAGVPGFQTGRGR